MNALRANGLLSGAALAPRIAASLVGAALLAAALPGSVLGATGDPPVADSGDTAWMLAATALVNFLGGPEAKKVYAAKGLKTS